jgi:hypothetical protein
MSPKFAAKYQGNRHRKTTKNRQKNDDFYVFFDIFFTGTMIFEKEFKNIEKTRKKRSKKRW